MPPLRELAKMIDHSLLHPTMTDDEMADGCRLALRWDVASVCIKPYAVPLARQILAGSGVAVGAVIGFPAGNSHVDVKLAEMARAMDDGAVELDFVVNVGKVLSREWAYVEDEVRRLNVLAMGRGGIVKVIFENDYLPADDTKIELCHICSRAGVAFVKTSSGYGFVRRENGMYSYAGATDHDLALMRGECPPSVQVKAAGGVRTLDDLLRVRSLGVTRAGATATETILKEARARGWE